MKKSRGILVLILTAIVTVFFCYTAAVGIGPTGTGAMKNIKTGLDLAGGVSITYQAKDSNPSSEDMSDTVYKLQKRVEQYSTEAQVYQEGSDRINVEIPGVTDANAILEELGQPGSSALSHSRMMMETQTSRQIPAVRPDIPWQEALTRSVQPDLWFWKVQMWQMLQAVQSSSRIPAAESTW